MSKKLTILITLSLLANTLIAGYFLYTHLEAKAIEKGRVMMRNAIIIQGVNQGEVRLDYKVGEEEKTLILIKQ